MQFPGLVPSARAVGNAYGNAGAAVGAAAGKLKVPIDHNAVRLVAGRMPPAGQNQGAPAALSPLQQAEQLVGSELNPLVAQLIAGYTGQGRAGAQAIQQLTSRYASDLAQEGPTLQGIYAPAEQSTAAANAALADRLSGAGQSSSDELAQRLASINEPGAVNPAVAQVAQNGVGAGNALAGSGNATLNQLLTDSANAQAYASKLPGIAKTAGIQSLGRYEGQIGTAETSALSALEQKAPDLINSAYGTLQGAQNSANTLNAENARTAATIGAENQRTTAALKAGNQRTAATIAAENSRSSNALTVKQNEDETKNRQATVNLILKNGVDPATGTLTPTASALLTKLTGAPPGSFTGISASTAATVANNAANQASKAASLNERVRHDTVGEAQASARVSIAAMNANTSAGRLALAKVTAAAKKGHASGALTAHETDQLVQGWHDGKIQNVRVAATNPKTGQPIVNASGVPQYVTKSGESGTKSYQDAVSTLVGLGKTQAEAQKAVDGIYAPGDGGRPWLTAQQQNVLTTANKAAATGRGTPVRADPATVNGHAVLDPAQYATLKAANALPPGQLTAEGFYVIA